MDKERLEKICTWAHLDLVGTILPWWCSEYIMDRSTGGYYGVVTLDGDRNYSEPRNLTLLGRMLFVFSSSYRYLNGRIYLDRANYAFEEMKNHFYDKEFGGAFVLLDADGTILSDTKPNYCEAFFIMGLAEYYHATGNEEALKMCLEACELMETHAKIAPGIYHATLHRDWSPKPGFDNGRKNSSFSLPDDAIMYPHHLCQAYFRLYQATHNCTIAKVLKELVEIMIHQMYDEENHSFITLVTKDMKRFGNSISYGHDCELSYLLINIVDELELEDIKERAYQVVSQVLENIVERAFDPNGCLYNGANLDTGETGNVHVWWAVSEAVSAMLCGYDITGKTKFLDACEKQINFIEKYFVNRETGDWYNNIRSDETGGHLSDGQHGMDKLNPGKCPFHNGQMCLEVIRRIDKMLGKV
ncbi:MAG: AGE family epimerase/isomerase [Lawsonibacter sp.]